jgi:hypothetical protein
VRSTVLILALLLAACEGEKPPTAHETHVGPPPQQICAEVRKGVEALDKQASIQRDDKGGAVVEQSAWMAMTPENHADLARTLAFAAACAAGKQSEAQPVRIRSETGQILLETTVSTMVDLRSFLKR